MDATAHARGVPLGAMVGGMVSRRGAWRWRLRGAADLLVEDGARRCARHPVLPGGPLRDSTLAVDHHRPGGGRTLPERRGPESRPRSDVRAGVRGPAPHAMAWLHDGR